METQFITDTQGNKTAAIIPFDEWERTEKAKEILEHVYLAGIIKERRESKANLSLDELMKSEGLTHVDFNIMVSPLATKQA